MATDNKNMISNIEKQIEEQQEKIKKLKAKKNKILAREKEKERKARTRNLIQIGAIISNMKIDTPEKAEKLLNEYQNNEKCKNWIDKIISSETVKKSDN